MRILFTTEGTYPYVMGGVSTWCDQLVGGLAQTEFHLLAVTGPHALTPGHPLPSNVVALETARLWRPRDGVRRAPRAVRRAFDESFCRLLGFVDGDFTGFSEQLLALAELGSRYDLWPLFQRETVWTKLHEVLAVLLRRPPRLAETTLALNWLRATLVPLLFVPPKTDLAHAVANGLCAVPAWVASRAHKIPLVLTEHGVYLRERYLGFGAEGDLPGVRLLRGRFHRALAQLVYRDADRLLSVSEFNRRWQVELGAPLERTRVVYNGVEPLAFPLAEAAPQSVPTVVWVGRIDPLKDLETLILAFAEVRRAVPAAVLRLFGPVPAGNEAYAARLRALVAAHDLTEQVRFEGPLSPVYRAYHQADVVVLSSISEGFPYTPIEAMMCSKPVVATRVGGVAEAIGSFGRLVEPRNPGELGAALSELLGDAPLRAQLGAASRARALERFTLFGMNGAYERLYGELAAPDVIPDAAPNATSNLGSNLGPDTVPNPLPLATGQAA